MLFECIHLLVNTYKNFRVCLFSRLFVCFYLSSRFKVRVVQILLEVSKTTRYGFFNLFIDFKLKNNFVWLNFVYNTPFWIG